MELDLDSLLNSNLTDDDENGPSNTQRRTVDEIILNDSSSSSSSSTSSSPKHIDISNNSKTLALVNTRSLELPYADPRTRTALFGSSSSSSTGGVRSNVKPGAALAAAFAASRNAPSPHAAAIKLRRATASSVEVLSQPLSEISSSALHFDDAGSDVNLSSSLVVESIVRDSFADENEGYEVRNVSLVNELTRDHSGLVLDTHITSTSLTTGEEKEEYDLKDYSVLRNDTDFDVNTEEYVTEPNIDAAVPEYENGRVLEEELISIPDKHDETEVIPSFENELDDNVDQLESTSSSGDSELSESVDMQLEDKGSETAGEETRLYMKPLDLAEELEKKYALTDSQGMKDAASQPMRLEGVHQGSTLLGYFDIDANNTVTRMISSETFRRDHGSAQVLAVHLNYIAIGMSKGVIICFPSKKSPSVADSSDAKIVMLGIQGDRSYSSVTAMCFNRQGDLLFAGYADGHYTVWDVQKATSLKIIREHKAPVVHIFYLGLDSQANRQFNVVSGDSKGVIKVIHFKYVPWLNRISISKQVTLLDETTSTVVCASPLLSDDYSGGSVTSAQGSAIGNSSSIGSMMGGVVGGDWKLFEGSSVVEEGVVIFVSHQSALVAKVNPGVEVYAQLPRPEGVREGCMPYAAWKYMRQPFTSFNENVPEKTSERVGLLALAWDRKVQVARLVKSELKICRKLTLKSSAVGVTWLDDQLLVVLTSDGQLCLFEIEEGTVIHETSFAVDGSRADDLIAYHAHFTNTSGIPEKAYHNCVAISGASIYVLGPMQLTISRLLPWKERIEVLRKAGDWIGALNMAISLYNGATHGVIDFPRTSDEVNNTVMPYLVELLLSYVDEVFSYISVAFCNQIGKLDQLEDSSTSGSVRSEIEEQFTRVGGVAVEFCVHIKRTDILFDEIHSRFVSVQHKDTFLELLEPYILNDKLGFLPPEIMQALVEHYSMKGWLQRIEQCVLHMDISSLDFNQVVRLCREHRLYGALIYLFNKGLDDFRTPLEELLVVLQNSQKDIAASIGYRMLVYLKYCFSGRAFPPGPGVLSPTRLQSVRRELVQFLLEDSKFPSSPGPASSCFTGACPNLYHLLFLDTEATLDVLKCAFVEDEVQKSDHSSPDSALSNLDSTKDNSIQNLSQNMVDVLAVIIDQRYSRTNRSISNYDMESNEIWPSKKDISHVVDFVAYYISCGKATVSKNILGEILVYLTSTSDVDIHPTVSRQNLQAFRKRERQVLEILEMVTETDWDASYLLSLCEEAHFYQVCGFIHAVGHQNLAALESYMKDADEPIHAFSFISCTLHQLRGKNSDAFLSEIMSRLPDLVILSREGTFFLVVEHFGSDHDRALCEMESHPKSLFLYLKTIMEAHTKGSLKFSCFNKGGDVSIPRGRRNGCQPNRIEAYLEKISEFPKLMRDNPVLVTDKIVEQYLELLCEYEPSSVLKFLETFENYRVEHCLRLCQKYGIVDATAFLLERVGDVGTALSVSLSVLDDKFTMLGTTVQGLLSNSSMKSFNTVLQKKEVNDILDIVHTCIGLCQRNSPRLDFDESESLWFRLLDSFCEPLIDSHSTKVNSEGKYDAESLTRSLDREENKSYSIRWKLSRFQKGAHILRKLFSLFIKEIVEGMIGYVRLPTIMMKLLSDNGSQEFGDFKLTILGMLGTYDFERRILDTAKSLIDDDNYYTMSQLKKGASHGYGPKSLLCCICNCPLAKNSTSSRIQVFNCGHTTHLQCELQENEASQGGFSAGCPICIPKKNTQGSKSKFAYAEQGLLSRPLSRIQPEGNNLHLNESEAVEGSYGFHPISRFEILTSLQKDSSLNHVDGTPQLRLAPPALYHEKVKNNIFGEASSSGKVKKGNDLSRGESIGSFAKIRKTSKTKQLRDLKLKGSSIRFPLKANIFGKEMISRRLQ